MDGEEPRAIRLEHVAPPVQETDEVATVPRVDGVPAPVQYAS